MLFRSQIKLHFNNGSQNQIACSEIDDSSKSPSINPTVLLDHIGNHAFFDTDNLSSSWIIIGKPHFK